VQPLLEVKDLRTSFFTPHGEVRAVDGISFSVAPGKLTGIVGESGSGKTVSVLSIMRLLPEGGRVVGGSITFDGADLLKLSEPEMRAIRGARIAMIFQEPMTSLNPVFTIGSQIGEAIKLHQHTSRAETRNRTVEALRMVGIADPERRIRDYPHQLSGGMRQRVMIAMALACNPRVLIADEPTTALDVTIQAQILALLDKLRRDIGMGVLFITHNLSVVAEIADRVVVMYSGRVVEEGDVRPLFKRPRHPYTRGLLECLPRRALDDQSAMAGTSRRLNAIPGQVASPLDPLPGCAFAPRCALVLPECSAAMPPLAEVPPSQRSRCIRWGAL
jgi:oligopeptide/dipeptide ABC transporter ATP-binding protein